MLYEDASCAAPAPALPAEIFVRAVPHLGRVASTIAERFFDVPSRELTIAGITGTNGKTTCAYLLAQALSLCGRRAAYMGTLGYGLPGALQESDLTTADAVNVQRQLAQLRELGAECVAMEVSSHALDQHRVAALRFHTAAFTQLTRDHLDYHGTMAAYAAAKARLFSWPELAARVINIDDALGEELARRAFQCAPHRDDPRVRAASTPPHLCAPHASSRAPRAYSSPSSRAGVIASWMCR